MSDKYINWFVYCIMPQLHPLIVNKFQSHQIIEDELIRHRRHPVEPGSYETWLWADDVKFCQELGCEMIVHHGYGWHEWGGSPRMETTVNDADTTTEQRTYLHLCTCR